MKFKGKNNLSKRLDQISKNARELDGKSQNFKSDDLFNEAFMKKHSSFDSFEKFIDECPLEVVSQEQFDELQDSDEFNEYVAKETTFESWEDMVQNAGFEQISKQIFE